jgi:hypothetical protein
MEVTIPTMRDTSLTDVSVGNGLCLGVWGEITALSPDSITLEVDRVAAINKSYVPGSGDYGDYGPVEEEAESPELAPETAAPPPGLASIMRRTA